MHICMYVCISREKKETDPLLSSIVFPSCTAIMLSSSWLTMLLSLLTTTSSLVLVLLLVVRRRKKERAGVVSPCLPPGSQGYPLVGETLRMIAAYKTERPDSFIDERVRMHGRVFTSHVFGERTVFSADPEVNRLVLQSEGRLLECSYPSSITTLLGKHSLLLTKGAYHKRMHSLTLSSFSNPAVLRDLLLPDIDRLVRRNIHSWADGRVLLLLDQAKKITFELAVKQLMSCEPGEWTEGLRKEYLLLINGFFSVPVPFKLPFTTYGRALKARTKVADQLKLVVRKRILQHQQQPQAAAEEEDSANSSRGGGGCNNNNNNNNNTNNIIKNRDVLDTLLSEGVTEEEEVVDFLLALLVAAYETTPTAMTLAVKFLTESPAALALLKEEHEKIRDRKKRNGSDDDPFDWSEYKSAMPFTHSVINETLRVSNIISGVFRRATTDIHIKGYTIPKGCKVFASFRAVHMDDDHFEDARTFNPWRWQKKRQQVDQGGGQQEYAPMSNTNSSRSGAAAFCVFGGGSRLCPGYELARVELCVFLHHLLTTFSWDAADEDKLVFFPTTRTLKGYPICVRRRSYPN